MALSMNKTINKYTVVLISTLLFTGCLGEIHTKKTRSFSGRNTFYKNSGSSKIEIIKTDVDTKGNLNIRIHAETRNEEYEGDYYIVTSTYEESPHVIKAFFLTVLFPVNMLLAPIASNSSYEQEFSDLRSAYFGNTLSTLSDTIVENASPTGNSSVEPLMPCTVEVKVDNGPLHHVKMTNNTGSINLNTLVDGFTSVPESLTLVIKASHEQESAEKKVILGNKLLTRLNLPLFDELADFEEAKKTNTLEAWTAYIKKYPESRKKDEILAGIADIYKTDNSVASAITYLESFPEGQKHFPVIAALLKTGPEKLKVKEILKFKQQGIGETLIIAKVSRVNQGYRDFSFDEIKVLKQMGLTDTLIQAMIDVTFRLEETALKNQQIEILKAENEKLRREAETAQVDRNTTVNPTNPSQENTFTDLVTEELKKEAAKKVAEKVLDFF